MQVRGLMIYGAITLLTSEDESAASNDPVWLPANAVDAAIANGLLKAGALKNVQVQPPAESWPERWRFLAKE
jgi:hypothetical protein